MTDIVTTFDNVEAEYIDDDAVQAAPATLEEADVEYRRRQIAQTAAAHRVANEPSRQRYAQESAARATTERERIAAAGGEDIATELRGGVGKAVSEVASARPGRGGRAQGRTPDHRGTAGDDRAHHPGPGRRTTRGRMVGRGKQDESSVDRGPGLGARHARRPRRTRNSVRTGPLNVCSSGFDSVTPRRTARGRRVPGRRGPGTRRDRENILTAAGSAADTLTTAGLTVDASAEDVIAHGGPEVIAAFKAWGQAVAAWGDLQSVRRWVSVAVAKGFRDKDPERLAYGEGVADVEAGAWRTQFAGVRVPVGVAGPHTALVWWTENERPAPTGVGSIETEASK
ncbi:hypothetical protein GS436_16940 [Rhodococcus hoagii]|nr:hypothetical protein [Prescottella equi]